MSIRSDSNIAMVAAVRISRDIGKYVESHCRVSCQQGVLAWNYCNRIWVICACRQSDPVEILRKSEVIINVPDRKITRVSCRVDAFDSNDQQLIVLGEDDLASAS